MYCPLCGSALLETKSSIKTRKENTNCREEYKCTKGCFQEDYPLYFHHPYRGTDSRPGDSWSLSWIK